MGAASVDNYKLSFEKYTEGWRQVHILKKKLQQNLSQGERSTYVDRTQEKELLEKILKLLERADPENNQGLEGKGRTGSQGLEKVKASGGNRGVKSWGSS